MKLTIKSLENGTKVEFSGKPKDAMFHLIQAMCQDKMFESIILATAAAYPITKGMMQKVTTSEKVVKRK